MAGSFSSGFSTGFVTSTPGSFSSGFSSGFAVSTSGTTWTGAATIAGAGSVAATAGLRALAQTTIAGTGGVTATARLSAVAKTTLAGVGGVAATGRLSAVASATLAGSGGVVVNTAILPPSRATLAGSGGVVVTANVVNIGLSRATIDGAGGVTVSTFIVPASRVTINGAGGVTVTGARVIAKATATLVGAGAVTVAPHIDSPPFVIEPPVPPSQQQVSPPSPIDNYLELIPAYNRVQPKFIGTLSAVLQPLVDLQALLLDMPRQFDLDYAVGVQLDQVGLWIGRDRFVQVPISNVFFSWDIDGLGWEQGTWQGTFDPDEGISKLDDETYRVLLYAKAAANGWDGSFEQMVVILNTLLQGRSLTTVIHDNQDMSLEVVITGILNDLLLTAVLQGGYLPIKPEGVKITYTLPQSTLPQSFGGVASLRGTGAVLPVASIQRMAATVSIAGTGNVLNVVTTQSGGARPQGTAAIAGIGALTATMQARLRATATLAGFGNIAVNANVAVVSPQQFTGTNTSNTISNGGVTASKTSNDSVYSASVGSVFKTSGKYYYELVVTAMDSGTFVTDIGMGIANPAWNVNAYNATNEGYLGHTNDSYGWYSNDPYDGLGSELLNEVFVGSDLPGFQPGNRASFAVDATNLKWWVRINNGAWNANHTGTQDPATNTGGLSIPAGWITAGGIAPAIVFLGIGDQIDATFSASGWQYVAPTGFGQM